MLSPLTILIYSYQAFTFDHKVYQVFEDVLPLGSFERRARAFADPVQIAFVRTGIDLLRIRSTATLILRVGESISAVFLPCYNRSELVVAGMDLSYCSRISSVATLLLREQRIHTCRKAGEFEASVPATQKPVPRTIAVLLGIFGALVLFYTHSCISTSSAQCQGYPSCVSYAHRWNPGASCPCLALIDIEKAPKTFDEWEHPRNVTADVRALAEAGTLKILQLINRDLHQLPDELSRCSNLRVLYVIG